MSVSLYSDPTPTPSEAKTKPIGDLLNLPEDILDALYTGKIAYTKAIALARLKDDEARQSLLKEAIEQNLSLDYIRQRVKALQAQAESESPTAQIEEITRLIKATKLWENRKRWKRVQALLQKLEDLIEAEFDEKLFDERLFD